MIYRNSTDEEINLIANFVVTENSKIELTLFGKEFTIDENVDSFLLAKEYFYSTLETPYNYKIITAISFKECKGENACDIFQSMFILFNNKEVHDITGWDWVAKDETNESLVDKKIKYLNSYKNF